MNEEEILMSMGAAGALIIESHIVYTSGKHGSSDVNKDAVYPDTEWTSALCLEIAKRFREDRVEAVIAPAIGGIILSQWTAFHLSTLLRKKVLGVYAEKNEQGGFIIKRGHDKLITGKRVLVVEDILTTGGSAKKVINAVRDCGGEPVGIGVLCNRGGITLADLADIPRLEALVTIDLQSWEAADCPLCADGEPINTDVGWGREFLAAQK